MVRGSFCIRVKVKGSHDLGPPDLSRNAVFIIIIFRIIITIHGEYIMEYNATIKAPVARFVGRGRIIRSHIWPRSIVGCFAFRSMHSVFPNEINAWKPSWGSIWVFNLFWVYVYYFEIHYSTILPVSVYNLKYLTLYEFLKKKRMK